jgi:hypothetical protein
MDPLLSSTLLKLAIPLATIAAVLYFLRRRGLSWRHELGLAAPRAGPAALWLAAWIAWMALTEWAIVTWGLEQARPWPDYPPHIVALRVAAIGLAGPAAEEVVFRGLAIGRLRRTRLGARGAIVLAAVGWAAVHVQYGPATMAQIAADGLLLGAARVTTGSLYVPIAMHALGNLLSIWQSTHA